MIFAETERTWLRPLRKEDFALLIEFMNDEGVNGPLDVVPFPFSYADAKAYLEKMQKTYESGKPEFFVIADKGTDDLMGAIGIHAEHTFYSRAHVGEMGYWLGREHWGQGYIRETLPEAIAYAFRAMTIDMILSTTNLDNEKSMRVLRALGFTCLGELKLPRPSPNGTTVVNSWELTRKDFEKGLSL